MSTRLWQAGWELNTIVEWKAEITRVTTPDMSTTKAFTGARSLRNTGANTRSSVGTTFASTTQITAQLYFNHNSVSTNAGRYALIYTWTSTAGSLNFIRWHGNTGLIELVINNSVVATVSAATAGITATDTWYAAGLRVFADATTGYVDFYIDGVSVLSATSQNTGTGLTALYIGGDGGSIAGWLTSCYFDDVYIDDTAGEIDSAPIPRRFLWQIANGNGGSSQWDGNDGNQVDNYLLVDDVTPDGDTTYVFTNAAGNVDRYIGSDITLPGGYQIVAVIPTDLCKRSSVTEQLKTGLTDSVNTSAGTAQDLPAGYGTIWERYTLQPDGSTWNETDANAMELRIESAGTF